MKKILFSAIAICGMIAANAQVGGSQESVSSNTNTTAGSVTSEFNLKIKVYNIIRIVPNINFDMSATFDEASELDNGKLLNAGIDDLFIVSSNRKFHVGMTAGPVTVANNLGGAGGNSSMPLSVFSYKAQSISSGVTLASNTYQTLGASQPIVTSGNAGIARAFGLEFKANPGWSYEGGNYTVPVTVTATQD